MSNESETYERVGEAYARLSTVIQPLFVGTMRKAYGENWRDHVSGRDVMIGFPVVCPFQTIVDRWEDFAPGFPPDRQAELKHSFESVVDARIAVTQGERAIDPMSGRRYLEAMRQIALAIGETRVSDRVEQLLKGAKGVF